MMISVFDRVENIVGKGEIACTSNFSFSHNVFKRLLSKMRQKVSFCGNRLRIVMVLDRVLLTDINNRIAENVRVKTDPYCTYVQADLALCSLQNTSMV